MAEIVFIANDSSLRIKQSATIIAGEANNTSCKFEFYNGWEGLQKTAVFYSDATKNKEIDLKDSDTCLIPWENLIQKGMLYVGLMGIGGEKLLPTNIVSIRIDEGITVEHAPLPPTMDVYMQIMNMMSDIKQTHSTQMSTITEYRTSLQENLEVVTSQANNAMIYAEDAKLSKESALVSLNKTITAQTNVKLSESNARISEENSLSSMRSAKTSEDNAKLSETNSKTSETNAKASETKSIECANNAKSSEDKAKASEQATKQYELTAKANSISASASETNARTSEVNAKTSEANAKISETNIANIKQSIVTDENARKTNESARVTAENDRKTSETLRDQKITNIETLVKARSITPTSYTATSNNVTEIKHNMNFKNTTDLLMVFFSGQLLELNTHYTFNSDYTSILLKNWSLRLNEKITFWFCKNEII